LGKWQICFQENSWISATRFLSVTGALEKSEYIFE